MEFKGKLTYILSAAGILVVIGLVVVFASFSIMGPKDLGVTYSYEDYQNSLEKTGIQIEFEGMTGEELEEYKKNAEKKSFHDYEFEFSDYQQKQFVLTNSEATALLNEIAPGFWWFDDIQVKVNPDGSMEGSSKADIKRLENDLYTDIADDVPVPLPDNLNIYSKGNIKITNNQLTGDPESLYLGPVPLPEKYMEEDSVQTMEEYIPRIYQVVPGLEITSLDANEKGEFVFDGVVPQKVTVTKKE
ncbi:hypothetical protein [Methanohalophilus portucalensis]|nr:hypothetical protein [Methanohalophilus portucalensis]ATU08743.1 hypothetical protein BKM01_08140 [Methanohalophilus portucalensis]OJH50136.1 hypothetical protein MPF_0931 [Methanohalophilus portucalensis FDF-1]SMH31206.1 hypothetical protein SAMN06264941_0417 [Methanohalophilus portucalensis FDF-1]